MNINIVVQKPIDVYYVQSKNGVSGAKNAFRKLEMSLNTLTGRKFYGVYFYDGSYRACLARITNDDPEFLDMPTWEIPGGRYASAKLEDWPNRLSDIGSTFDSIESIHPMDTTRPCIEFYQSQKKLVLFLPILDRV